MSIPLIINGITYNYPQQFDTNWGPTLTAWSTAVTNGMLQKAGGSFTLTADADFGMSFGLKALYLKSEEASIAHTGVLRLASQSTGIVFRNTLDSADLVLTTNSSNMLTFNGVVLGPPTALLNGHMYVGNVSNQPADVLMSGDTSITNTGVVTIANSAINNAKVSASAAIDRSKTASGTAYVILANDAAGVMSENAPLNPDFAIVTDVNGQLYESVTTTTELSYVSGVTSSIQTQIDALTSTPTGMLADFAGTVAPSGWLVCDGSAISQTTYAPLYSVIGTTWNTGGEGAGNFRLPALSRKVTVGSGGSGSGTLGNAVGNTGGAETHVISSGELPTHNHTITDPGHTHTTLCDSGGQVTNGGSGQNTMGRRVSPASDAAIVSATTGITTQNSGSSTAMSLIQPSAVVLKIIKT